MQWKNIFLKGSPQYGMNKKKFKTHLATLVSSSVDASCLYQVRWTSAVCPKCSVTHSNSSAFISTSCNTVAMCFLIFVDVISSGFLRPTLWVISCTACQPRTCLRDLLVVHGNKNTLLSGILIFLRFSSKISITSCTSGRKIVGTHFVLFPLEYISSKRVQGVL